MPTIREQGRANRRTTGKANRRIIRRRMKRIRLDCMPSPYALNLIPYTLYPIPCSSLEPLNLSEGNLEPLNPEPLNL
jgi:hypothetical protein